MLSNVILYWPGQRWSNGCAPRARRRSTTTHAVGHR